MIYSLLIVSSPTSGHCLRTAAAFARQAIKRGHRIQRAFFLDAGTRVGAAAAVLPQDEVDLISPWVELAQAHSIDLVLCVSSALRHGMLDATEAQRHDKGAATTHPAFTISGLGQLVDACANSDRLITFGG